jgi:hypothetical protein
MLNELAKDLWVAWIPQSFYGLRFGARMTVVRLDDGTLFLHSPIPIDEQMKTQIDALGRVEYIVAPNLFHHVHAHTAVAHYPSARLYVARGLDKKRPDLQPHAILGAGPPPDWSDEIEALPIEGTILNETAFLHRPSGTLICSDLIENFGTSDHWLTRAYLRVSGVHGQPGLSRALRLAFRDKPAARKSLDAILDRPFEAICLAHGDPILRDGPEVLKESYRWLRP